jgi:vitamin B12 transporter
MTTLSPRIALCALALAIISPPAGADRSDRSEPAGGPGESIVVPPIQVGAQAPEPDRGLDGDDSSHADRERALDEPSFATVVRIEDRAGETVTAAEVLAESVGVQVRSLGGLGGFSSISVRGASPSHTAIAIDDVPLSRIAAAVINFDGIDLSNFDTVELYRGTVPAEQGGAGLGGAVNFRTAVGPGRAGETVELSVGAGSFGARHARARLRDELLDGALAYQLAAGYTGARGDYEYFNDKGTRLNLTDDEIAKRTNNDFAQGQAVARARYRSSGLAVTGGARTLLKSQGVPGTGTVQTRAAQLDTLSQLVDARVERASASLLVRGSGYALLERQHFADLLAEVGLGVQDDHYQTTAGGVSAAAVSPAGERQLVSLGIEGRVDDFRNQTRTDVVIRARRWSGAVSLSDEVEIGGEWLVVVPALRVDAMTTNPGAGWHPLVVDPAQLGERRDLFVSPRLAARARTSPALTVKGSAGRYVRMPTVPELFGDRGFLVGDPALKPESGVSADTGAVYAPAERRGPADRIVVQAAGFVLRPRDVIAFEPAAGNTAVARNLGDAWLWGAESAATVRLWQRATLAANYTYIDSVQDSPRVSFDGKRLPSRPRHQTYLRADLAQRSRGRLAVLWADVTVTSGNFLDAGNIEKVPARRLLGAGIKLEPMRQLLVGVEGKNLTNHWVDTVQDGPSDSISSPRAVTDFFGYPLPGRAFYLTIDWTH